MYGPGSNRITPAIATNLVGTCFSFVRYYWGNSLNARAAVTAPPYYVRTDDTHGGSCNLTPCTGSAERRALHAADGDDHRPSGRRPRPVVVLSTYKQLTGAKLSGSRRWDCTSGDPRKHWTSEVESYCLKDLLAALDAIKPGSVVTDPATVGEAWGRRPGSPPPTTTTTMPGGTDVANPNTTLSAPRSGTRVASPVAAIGSASDDRAVAAVRVAIRNEVTGLWLQTNNTSWGPYQTRNAVLETSGTTTTGGR